MRNLFYILILFLFHSCHTPKNLLSQEEVNHLDSLNHVGLDSLMSVHDSTPTQTYPHILIESAMGMSNPPRDYYESAMMTNPRTTSSIPDTVTNEMNNYNFGFINYYIPDTMKVGQSYRIELRISKYKTTQLVVTTEEKPVEKQIRIGHKMEAKLIDVDGVFNINTTNTPEQSIDMDSSYTSWVWFVVPKKSGKHELRLIVVIKDKDTVKDIPVYEDKIYIQAAPLFTVWGFIKEYWQWIVGALAGCFTWYWANLRKKKRRGRK